MDARAALRDIVHLASDIGPREATSDNFADAAQFVEMRFERLGYDVRRTKVPVPAGNSWGTPVRGGTSLNVIAEPNGFDASKPHVVIGAHLDTVAVAPGAEDNASGIAVMLQLAAMVSQQPAVLPVQFIAFGAEEPRGRGDTMHHFGSRQHVADLSRSERRAVQAMVSLDRVGVRAGHVPICTATGRGDRLRDALRAAARRADIATRACTNYTSDHWSYAKADVPAVRLGSIPYAGYHSRGDVPSVVDRRQIDRVGRTVWAWLQTLS
jgi:Zn-dependent M28 family amino/carboxypeptidase